MLQPCAENAQNQASDGGINNHICRCRSNKLQVTIEDIADPENLLLAYKNTVKNKSKKRAIRYFKYHFAKVLNELHNELINRTYKPLPPYEFDIWCTCGQKMRHISAPRIRDSVVMHAIYQCIYQYFDQKLIYDSYGCRVGGGAIKAADRVQYFVRHSPKDSYYLQLDIRKYYYSINHEILRKTLEKYIEHKDVTDLIMMYSNHQSGVGLCVGFMLSQFLGLVYLNRLDHYIKRVLKVKHYIRYVDDMLLIGLTKQQANYLKSEIERYLKENLDLTFSKFKIQPLKHGINYTGFRTWQRYRLTRKRIITHFKRSLKSQKVESIQALISIAERSATFKYLLSLLVNNSISNQLCKRFKNELQIYKNRKPRRQGNN